MADFPNNFLPADKDGVLPIKGSASQFRIKKAIIWKVDLLGFGVNGKTAKNSFKITFAPPGGEPIYQSTITIELFMVSLSLGGISFFTWNFVKDKFDTKFAGGVATNADNIGQFLLGGTALSEQGDMQPASGQDNTDLTATIVADWISPIYAFTVPAGTQVKVENDSWGFGPKTVEYSFAFKGSSCALRDPRTGEAWVAHAGLNKLLCTRTRRPDAFPIDNLSPTIVEGDAGNYQLHRSGATLHCVYDIVTKKDAALGRHIAISTSTDEGENWLPATLKMPIPGYQLIKSVYSSQNGALYAIAKAIKADADAGIASGETIALTLKLSSGIWSVASKTKITVKADPSAKDGGKFPLDGISDLFLSGTLIIAFVEGKGKIRQFHSVDGMANFKEIFDPNAAPDPSTPAP